MYPDLGAILIHLAKLLVAFSVPTLVAMLIASHALDVRYEHAWATRTTCAWLDLTVVGAGIAMAALTYVNVCYAWVVVPVITAGELLVGRHRHHTEWADLPVARVVGCRTHLE